MDDKKVKRIIALLNHLKRGEHEYFEEFYTLTKYQIYYSLLTLTKNSELAEDMLAETYVRFLENVHKLNERKNPLGYMLITARNLTLDYLKRENRVTYIEDYVNEDAVGATSDQYDTNDELLLKMQTLLSDIEYEVVILYVLSELTHKEIAKQLKKPLGTVTWLYSNAIKKLQKGLSDYDPTR